MHSLPLPSAGSGTGHRLLRRRCGLEPSSSKPLAGHGHAKIADLAYGLSSERLTRDSLRRLRLPRQIRAEGLTPFQWSSAVFHQSFRYTGPKYFPATKRVGDLDAHPPEPLHEHNHFIHHQPTPRAPIWSRGASSTTLVAINVKLSSQAAAVFDQAQAITASSGQGPRAPPSKLDPCQPAAGVSLPAKLRPNSTCRPFPRRSRPFGEAGLAGITFAHDRSASRPLAHRRPLANAPCLSPGSLLPPRRCWLLVAAAVSYNRGTQ
jgi:hypothetical protein